MRLASSVTHHIAPEVMALAQATIFQQPENVLNKLVFWIIKLFSMKLIEIFSSFQETIVGTMRDLAVTIGGTLIFEVIKSYIFKIKFNSARLFDALKRSTRFILRTPLLVVKYSYLFIRNVVFAVFFGVVIVFLIYKIKSLKVETQNVLLALLLLVVGGVLLYHYLNKSKKAQNTRVLPA